MKPLFFKIPITTGESLKVQYDVMNHFYDNLHFHPEIQLMLILESTGTRFIGDNIGNFKPGDIFLLGSNLPHVFRNDKRYYEENTGVKAKNISVFFNPNSFGETFFSLPEAYKINKLLQLSKRGISIKGETNSKIKEVAERMLASEGFERLIQLFTILHIIACSKDLEMLSTIGFYGPQKESDSKKINDVFTYVIKNFSEEIKLQEAADIANMSVNAFCRYFKQHTRKTFSKFLNEIRIGHACRILMEDKWNIRETAFECGYDNISYFNRQFKLITGYTPSDFVKMHHTQMIT